MSGCAEIEFHLPVLDRLLFAVFLQSFFYSFFDPQRATGGMSCPVSKEAFRKFIVCVTLASFFELGNPSEVPRSIVEFAEFYDLVLIFVMLLFEFSLLEFQVIAVVTRIRLHRLSLGIKLKNGRDGVIQKRAVVRDDEHRTVETR